MLLGGESSYDDYGHPERSHARKYWSIRPAGGPDAYGSTKAEAAQNWLWKKNIHVFHETGNIHPMSYIIRSIHEHRFDTDL